MNLIGGQVDYHEGIVVSAAIDRTVTVAYSPRRDDRIRVGSDELGGVVEIPVALHGMPETIEPSWGRLVVAIAAELAARGVVLHGFDARVSSTLPVGAGLGSSAAFEVAIALACCDVADTSVDRRWLARVCQAAELAATGVPCGLQDQLSTCFGVRGAAVRIDCRDLDVRAVPLPAHSAVLVVHSGIERSLSASAWGDRRDESLAVAAALGLRVLRDATIDDVAHHPRGRHVVSEIDRVERFVGACERGDAVEAGRAMMESHASSRDDMEVSIPELDLLVELCATHGAYGARLTGGGFGGCVVALVPRARATQIRRDVVAEYEAATGRAVASWHVTPVGAAEVLGR